jgi:6-pyruvoyltetrahydropterin/6-carboxytetrahydropterin synthase
MISCVRRLHYSIGHRLLGHGGSCQYLHGHNYVFFIHARAEKLDKLGMVCDFSVLKARMGGWVAWYWDHGFIYNKDDKLCADFFERSRLMKSYAMPCNPTAENMGQYLLDKAPEIMVDTGVTVFKIVLWETENCFAEVTL